MRIRNTKKVVLIVIVFVLSSACIIYTSKLACTLGIKDCIKLQGTFTPLDDIIYTSMLACRLGIKECIKSQGTFIPLDEATRLHVSCNIFTKNDIGYHSFQKSGFDVYDKENVVALQTAKLAFEDIYHSSLKFKRHSKSKKTNYWDIKRSCWMLERDLNMGSSS